MAEHYSSSTKYAVFNYYANGNHFSTDDPTIDDLFDAVQYAIQKSYL